MHSLHSVWKLLKMSHLNFPIYVLSKLTYLVKSSPKLTNFHYSQKSHSRVSFFSKSELRLFWVILTQGAALQFSYFPVLDEGYQQTSFFAPDSKCLKYCNVRWPWFWFMITVFETISICREQSLTSRTFAMWIKENYEHNWRGMAQLFPNKIRTPILSADFNIG